jgi:LmbE family N-acetylglucosaminyl deacetylase
MPTMPDRNPAEIFRQSTRFLAMFAHCDDIEMRMGGTFARLIREGKRVTYTVVVENAYYGPHIKDRDDARTMLAVRRAEATRGAKTLGASRIEFLAFKSYYLSREDTSLVYPTFNSVEETVKELEGVVLDGLPPIHNAYTTPVCHDLLRKIIREERPEVIFTQSPDDRHPDHYAMARILTLIVEDMHSEGIPVSLWYSEPGTGGSMAEFWPNTYVELSPADQQVKEDAMACFPTQFPGDMRAFNAERSRAYGSIAGVPLAESWRAGMLPRMGTPTGDWFTRLAAGPQPPTVIRL